MKLVLPDGRIAPRWLVPARLTWVGIVMTTVAVFLQTLPLYYANLQSVCLSSNCPDQRLSQVQAIAWSNLGWGMDGYAALFIGVDVVFGALFLAAGALIFVRRSDDWLALFVSLMLVTFGLITFQADSTILPDGSLLQFLVRITMYFGSVGIFVFFAIFPRGRPIWHWNTLLLVVWAVYEAFEQIVPTLFGRPSDKLPLLNSVFFMVMIGVSIFAQVYRFRFVSNPDERQQTKWVVYGTSFGIGAFFVLASFFALLPPLDVRLFVVGNILLFLSLLFVPISITVAILRSHLWNIDIIIRRTLIYSTLTALLALVYFGSVVALQQILVRVTGQQQGEIVTVLSTLAIAAMFVPSRRRVQWLIDRRFYRRKYDAQQVLARFAETVRDQVELEMLSDELLAVVNETMQPASSSLWLRAPEGKR